LEKKIVDTNLLPDFDVEINRLGTGAEKFDSRQRIFGNSSVQPLWVADMDLGTPPFLQKALADRITHPCYGYTEQSDELKHSVIWWMKEEHSLEVATIEIAFSPSVVTTFNNAIEAYSEPGDGVALFSPVYGPFYFAIKNHKRTLVDIPLLLNSDQYEIDFEILEQKCSSGEITVLLFCNPQNPSGRVWNREELTQLVSICSKYGVTIVSDEIHSDIIFEEEHHHSILTIDGAEECSIVAHSIGKTFNTSGLQASFSIIKDRKLRQKYHRVAELSHTNDINLLGKVAIETLFSEEGQVYKRELISYLQDNRDLIVNRLSKIESLKVMIPESTFLIWIDFSGTGLSHDEVMKRLVDEAEIGLGQGKFFGPCGELWFRWNFAITRDLLIQSIEKVEKLFVK